MPCEGGPTNDQYLHEEIDKLTRMLCYLCTKCHKELIKSHFDLSEWWDEHQREDKERDAEEKRLQREENEKQLALGKLTRKERRLLGIIE